MKLTQVITWIDVINTMRDVLKFCARGEVGTYYQQQSAREMAINNTHVVWNRYNPDGSTTEDYRKWIYQCAEGRKRGQENERSKNLTTTKKNYKSNENSTNYY